jgi:diguanylate cyclase (GGDEF)-like protein
MTATSKKALRLYRAMRLPLPRLGSIRNRILAFALMATIVPSGITMGLSYMQSRRALEEKVAQDLLSASEQTARAMGVWLKEHLYDLRVFASSEEVANTLERGQGGSPNSGRLGDYLQSLHERFADFDVLSVIDLRGRVVGTSARRGSSLRLPKRWMEGLRTQSQSVGDAYWDESSSKGKLVVVVPVQSSDGRVIGGFAAEVNLKSTLALLKEFAHDSGGAIHLVTSSGAMVASTIGITQRTLRSKLNPSTLDRLTNHHKAVVNYRGITGRRVVGALEPVPQAPWAVVSELESDVAYRQMDRSRDFSLLLFVILLVAVGASGYRFGVLIARPLDRLTLAAAEVASGDLAVDLPEGGSGEVGSLTIVFNHMVSRLREGRRALDEINDKLRAKNEELERLSTTDGLTGLANHRLLMQRLSDEGSRSNRSGRPFAVLMADVDRFKEYNDAYGHPAGDDVLKRVATIMRDCTRAIDCVGRYGGEEFMIILTETSIAGALEAAERIRAKVAATEFSGRHITLSIGAAEFPKHADVPASIIALADSALYEAKRKGRDRVVEATKGVTVRA